MVYLLNITTIGFLIGTVITLWIKFSAHKKKSVSQYLLIFSFCLLIVGTFADTLHHLGFEDFFDIYGEYINLWFFPLIIFSIFSYTLKKELGRRKQSEQQLQRQNLLFQNINLELSERNDEIKKINEALSKSNMEMDSFVYRVTHDLRAPLCSALGLINLSKQSDNLNDMKGYLDLQESSLKRMDQFIRDILDYSINAHSDLAFEVIDFEGLVGDAFRDYGIPNQKLPRVAKDLKLDYTFCSDPVRLKIVFNNLIANAIKFQRESEEHKLIEVLIQTTRNVALISIKDNGIGFQEKYKKEVFNIFFRANDQTIGSGLGLYIVKDCIEKLGGSVNLISQFGVGTTITITIPNKDNYLSPDISGK